MPEDPYSSPESQVQPPQPPPMVPKPSRMVTFGILHIAAAVIGFGGLIFNIVQGLDHKKNVLDALQKQPQGQTLSFSEDSLKALDDIVAWNTPILVGQILLCALILIAGIGLLKATSWCLKLSNIYSFASIMVKIALVILTVTVLSPAYHRFFDGIEGADSTFLTIMKAAMIGGHYTPLLVIIYPILSAALLNRKIVSQYLRNH